MRRRVHRCIVAQFETWGIDDSGDAYDDMMNEIGNMGGAVLVDERVDHPCKWLPGSMRDALSPLAFGEREGRRSHEVHVGGRVYVADGAAMYLVEQAEPTINAARVIEDWKLDAPVEALDRQKLTPEDLGKPNAHHGVLIGRTLVDLDYVEAAMLLFPDRGEWLSLRTGKEVFFDAVKLMEGPLMLAMIMGQRPL